jgi:ligand-binding SRPBCC domain-containing protein
MLLPRSTSSAGGQSLSTVRPSHSAQLVGTSFADADRGPLAKCRSSTSRVPVRMDAVSVSFECVTQLAVAPEAAFDLSSDVEAHTSSMARSGEQAVGGIRSGRLGLNDEVTWRARHFGVPWQMTSKITEWERPGRFVDEQVRGPFASFRHEHFFEPSETGTRMVDRVAFSAPLGGLGRLAERVLLGRYVQQLIETRNQFLAVRANSL